MGRRHPTICKHGKLIDVGSLEGLDREPCEPCEREAEEIRRWLDIRTYAVTAAIDDSMSNEQLGRYLRALMNLPATPPFTGESRGDPAP